MTRTIAFYGSSLLSAYWNGAATYYRGILRALAARGHAITFYEPDVHDRQAHRDIDPPDWCRVVVYDGTPEALRRAAAEARHADIVVKCSGVGFEDDRLLAEVMAAARPGALRIFWDVDAPATLAELSAADDHPLRRAVPGLDLVLTYGGGDPVVAAYRRLGARACVPIYNALDFETHHPVPPEARFAADLLFLGNRLPDRDARVEEFFTRPARLQGDARFLLGGSGWHDQPFPANVRRLGHVPTADHNALNVSARMVLNVARDSMAANGFSPATRVFEAAGAGACLVTDAWEGIGLFLKPGEEVLVARDGQDVADLMASIGPAEARRIGEAALARVLAEHTYDHRAALAADTFARAFRAMEPGDMTRPLDIVILGLTLSSSWGNGHATTFRSLLAGLRAEGHRVLFLERDKPWYAAHRDLPAPDFAELVLYDDLAALAGPLSRRIRAADAVIVGSYVPEGREVIDLVAAMRPRLLCFYDIDTPVTLDLLDAAREEHLAARQVPLFDLYFSFFSGGAVLDHLERARGARAARALYCSVDAHAYAPRPEPAHWDLGYLGTYSPDRQPGLESLLIEPARRLPGRRFVVAGSGYPEDIDWPANVERIEHLPPQEHPAFYCRQRFTLNVTRAAMRRMGWSPSVRLFEAAACGTPILSDAWPGLDEILPVGEAIRLVASPEDTIEALTRMPEPARLRMAEAARARVLGGHTGQARARGLVEDLRRAAAAHDRAPARMAR